MGSVDFLECVAAVPSNVRPDGIQQVCVAGVNYGHRHAVDVVREADVICSTLAWRYGVAIQVRARRWLIDVEETGQMDSIVAVIAHIKDPAAEHFALNVQAPLGRVRILVINRDAALQLRRCR